MTRVWVYVGLMVLEALLAWFAASRAGPVGVRALINGEWHRPLEIVRDVIIAALVWSTIVLLGRVLSVLQPIHSSAAVNSMIPRTPIEYALWAALSLSAGFAEELAFRGWLQQRVFRWANSWPAAIAIQAVVFGFFHVYQDVAHAARIILVGALFGVVAWWRRSLRPGMIAHAWTDLAAGLFGI